MKVAIVSCFDAYDTRLYFIERYFKQRGDEPLTIVSDFDHAKKTRRTDFGTDRNLSVIHVPAYRRNLSLARIYSHYSFAKNVCRFLKNSHDFDLIYAMIPPNFLCSYLKKYKKQAENVRMVFDIYDLWPESMTRGGDSRLMKMPFALWAGLRNRCLTAADYVFMECGLYREKLKPFLDGVHTDILYISKRGTARPAEVSLHDGEIALCYLGSINNIIDIAGISELIAVLSAARPVTLHIIGDGEKRAELIGCAQKAGASVKYHGMVYEEAYKQEVFSECHFGINMMKSAVCVGLSQKSIDYFEAGLPVINTIPHDTWRLIEKWNCGINIKAGQLQEQVQHILDMDMEAYMRLRENAARMFDEEFGEEKIISALDRMCGVVL